LGSVVSRSLVALRKRHPGIGWVRGDTVLSGGSAVEILRLRSHIDVLEAELAKSKNQALIGAEKLAQGTEIFEVHVDFETEMGDKEYEWQDYGVDVTWDELFFTIGPLLMHEATTYSSQSRLAQSIERRARAEFNEIGRSSTDDQRHGHSITADIRVSATDLETVVVQFAAIGYIAQSVKTRNSKDHGDYWSLTPYGYSVMNQLRAVPAGERSRTVSESDVTREGGS
jgi:hypothetical protein